MQSLMRTIAVMLRRREESRQERSVSVQFQQWLHQQRNLPAPNPDPRIVALVRLDDIGDYLLWRNFLPAYRRYYAGRKLLLIGNKVWESVFQVLDADYADEFVGLDKGMYMRDTEYRYAFWERIRSLGVSELVSVSRTRPLLLDDCIAAASAAPLRIAAQNSFRFESWNLLSDKLYTRLVPSEGMRHEFLFNRNFAQLLTNAESLPERLHLEIPDRSPHRYIVCFIGASAKSKRWPVGHWIQLIRLLQEQGLKPLLAGGPSDQEMADTICAAVSVDSQVGQLSLLQTLALIAGAPALISGDTMAAHAGVGASVPTVILANGVNASRFVAYREAAYDNVETCYTKAFLKYKGSASFTAVTRDMASIRPQEVMASLKKLLGHSIAYG